MTERAVHRAVVCACIYAVGSVLGWLLVALLVSAVLR